MAKITANPRENADTSFVKIENGNIIKLSIKQIAKLYTQYAKIILEIKEMKDKKVDVRRELLQKLIEIDEEYKNLVKMLPQQPEAVKAKVRSVSYPAEKTPEIEFGQDAFASLRKEFERIRDELESIK